MLFINFKFFIIKKFEYSVLFKINKFIKDIECLSIQATRDKIQYTNKLKGLSFFISEDFREINGLI